MILTLTPNPAVDQTIEMDEPLKPNTVQEVVEARFDSGGNGINVSQFVRALDGETVATGITGGFTGYYIERELEDFGISTDFCSIDAAPTRINTTLHLPEPKGPETTRLGEETTQDRVEYQLRQRGPTVTDHVVDLLIETVKRHDPTILNIGGSLPPGMSADAVDELSRAGDWITAVDLHGEVIPELGETYEYCRINRAEVETATGMTIDSITEGKRAALELQRMGFERAIVSMGAEGAVMVTPEQVLYSTAVDTDVTDTVAAGDAMFATILWAHEKGWDDEKALRACMSTAWKLVSTPGSSVSDLNPQDKMDEVQVWELSG